MEGNANKPSFLAQIKDLGTLYIQNARFTLAEKMSMLMSVVALCAVAVLIGMSLLIFFGLFLADLLSSVMVSWLAVLTVFLFYVLLFILVVLLRKPLIEDPITRYVSRLLIDPPTKRNDENN